MFKTISAAALIAAMGTTAFAGALSDPIVEEVPVVAAGSSAGIGAPAVLGAVVAAAALAALVADDDDEGTSSTPTSD